MSDKTTTPFKPLSATNIGVKDKIPVMRGSFLRFPRAMREVARVSNLGGIKYDAPVGSMDYLEIDDGIGVFTDALGRHLLDEATGGEVNLEKGGHLPPEGMRVLHQAQVAWNALARLERRLKNLEEKGVKVDDLFLLDQLTEPMDRAEKQSLDTAAEILGQTIASPDNPLGESEEVVKTVHVRQGLPPLGLPHRREPEAHTLRYPGPGQERTYSGHEILPEMKFEDVNEEILNQEMEDLTKDARDTALEAKADGEYAEKPVTVKSADVRKPVVYPHLPERQEGEKYLAAPHLPKRRSEREDEVGG